MTINTYDLVVTRHRHLVTVLRERGLIADDTPWRSHITDHEQVRGKHVIGVLPHHLSARAASITEVPFRWSEATRAAMQRGDVGLDETRAAAGDPVTYIVNEDRRSIAASINRSNLTGLDDLAAAAYSVQATSPILWADLTEMQRSRWIATTAFLLEVILPPDVHDQSEEMDRVRGGAIGARRQAEIELRTEADHQATCARIRANR